MTEGLCTKVGPRLSAVNSLLDRTGLERRAPFFDVHGEAHGARIVALHHLLAGGMKFAYELIEGEPCHGSAALFLCRNELLEYLAEVCLFALHSGGGCLLKQLFRYVGDRRGILELPKSIIVLDNGSGPGRRIVGRGRQILLAVPDGSFCWVTRRGCAVWPGGRCALGPR